MVVVQMEYFQDVTNIRWAGVGRGYCLRVAGARAFEDLVSKHSAILETLDKLRLTVTVAQETGPVRHRRRDRRAESCPHGDDPAKCISCEMAAKRGPRPRPEGGE